jgi:predicted metalloprotease with PDZ domain
VAKEFELVRITRMRGVNLDLFDFDYDLTWMGFFLNADGVVYGRYGGRDAQSADSRVSLAGLRHAMQAALAQHRRKEKAKTQLHVKKPRTVEAYAAAKRLPERACIHCHQVYDLRRESLQAAGKWRLDELWVYPLPENVGLTLDRDRGDKIAEVAANSAAARVGIRGRDRLIAVNGQTIASIADLQYALHRAPTKGTVPVIWQHEGRQWRGTLTLAEGWRKTDISWRWSLRGLDPSPRVDGDDLSEEEKKALGLSEKRLAFRQGPFVSEPARQAGIRQNDVIVGIDGKTLEMTARQFVAYVRLNYRVGDRVTYNVLRKGKRVDVVMRLTARVAP